MSNKKLNVFLRIRAKVNIPFWCHVQSTVAKNVKRNHPPPIGMLGAGVVIVAEKQDIRDA